MVNSVREPENGETSIETERSLLILNPHSRSGSDAVQAVVDRLLDLGPVHVLRADDPEEARSAILEYGNSATRVVLGGGDGTLSFMLQAILDTGSILGVLPLGTANDFARSLGIPLDLVQATDIVVRGQVREVDVGVVNDNMFLNAVGIGVGPEVTREMDSESKRQLGVFAYPVAVLSVLKDAAPFRVRLDVDGLARELDCLQVTIGNGIHYGGGMTIAEDARLDSGRLAVLCILEQPKWQLAGQAFSLRNGTAEEGEAMEVFSGQNVRVETDVQLEATADGELITQTPLVCHTLPRALRVLAPLPGQEA